MKDSALHQNLLIKFYFPTYLSTTPTIKVLKYTQLPELLTYIILGLYIYIYNFQVVFSLSSFPTN